MILLASTLPENSNDGYVAAAYIVFLALVLIYVAIMAIRLGRVEHKLEALRSEADRGSPTHAERTAPDEDPAPPTLAHPQERETV
ncbi:MAG: hypothetical protein WA484_14815 [Solirubrobacteraceae bacterium]